MANARAKSERLEVRVSPEQKEFFLKGAALRGSTLSEFVVNALQEAAMRTVKEFEMLELSARGREVFVNTLLNPPMPNSKLRDAADEYKKLMSV